MRQNQNPRQVLAGWRLHPRAAWTVLALNLSLPASAWLPGDWTAARAMLQVVGCVAGGVLVASRGALWQRVDTPRQELDRPGEDARTVLAGWRYHPHAARVLLALLVGGVTCMAWLPKEWVVLRGTALVLGTFAAGALAARDAAVWERVGETRKA